MHNERRLKSPDDEKCLEKNLFDTFLQACVYHDWNKSRAITGRTARCRCKFRYVLNFTTASWSFPATARLSCWSLSADCSESSVKKWQVL